MNDLKNIERVIEAQENPWAGYEIALAEIKQERKVSHWIWYIFPQLRGPVIVDTRTSMALPTAKKQIVWIVENIMKGYEDLIKSPRIQGDGDFMLYLSLGRLVKQMENEGATLRIMFLKPDNTKSDGLYTLNINTGGIKAAENKRLFHTIGNHDPHQTILTEKELCDILTELRKEL